MISIVSSQSYAWHLATYSDWVYQEWKSGHSFETPDGNKPLPPPLLAIDGEVLVGGISFTWHPVPDSSETALWINTLFVEPSYRGKGIARDLITAAEQSAFAEAAVEYLLAYTNIPELYVKNGWSPISEDNKMWVLRKQL